MGHISTQDRNQIYYQLSSQLAQIDNAQLGSLLGQGEPRDGWGKNQTLEIGESKVFVKRIPVTDIEHENAFSTANLYDLPTRYSYGIGSTGFGVWRELVAHIKTTNWVLSGEIENFPLLYHYRLIPFNGDYAEIDQAKHKRFVEYWGGDENIGQYMLDRASATYELVLFLEHIPHVLQPWLLERLDQVDPILEEVRSIADFLSTKGMIHFDAHFYNILTDGEQTYLTDFGLLLDRSFTLREDEEAFFNLHTQYDHMEIISNLAYLMYGLYEALPENEQQQMREKYGLSDERNQFLKLLTLLSENIEELNASGVIKTPQVYRNRLHRYREIISLKNAFFADLRFGNKDAKFPHEELNRLLNEK